MAYKRTEAAIEKNNRLVRDGNICRERCGEALMLSQ